MLTKWIGAIALAVAALAFTAPVAVPAAAQERTYEVGQVWAYETAPGDEGSLIKIREIQQLETDGGTVIVYHISMSGVSLPGQPEPTVIAHLPVSRSTLDSSVTQLVDFGVQPEPDFLDYREGKAIWEANNGGWFTIPLADVSDVVRQSMAGRGSAAKK